MAGELLPEFDISTKVGFFSDESGSAEHCLTPKLLRYAVNRTVDDLGTEPSTILLHNPEQSLAGLPSAEALDRLQAACAVLEDAQTQRLCRQWGWSTWNPGPLLSALTAAGDVCPQPGVLMVRAGLLVSSKVLDAADRLFELLTVPIERRWGMSPFGGTMGDPLWDGVDARVYLADEAVCTQAQAALRTAFELPAVERVVVGTDNLAHLRDLVMATALHVDIDVLCNYRELLRGRQGEQHQPEPRLARVRR